MDESRHQQGGHELITESIAMQLGVYLLRQLENNCPAPKEARYRPEKKGIIAMRFQLRYHGKNEGGSA